MPKTEAELDRMIERVRNQWRMPMDKKTQGEKILDQYTKTTLYANKEWANFRVRCAQATHQERAANALERIADQIGDIQEIGILVRHLVTDEEPLD